jgi:membrane protein DedA with SNARE-associated domain
VHELSDFWPFFTTFAALVAAGFGFPIPEEIPTVCAGVWVGSHPEYGPLRWLILPVCFAGVLISDITLYGIGRWWGPRLLQFRWTQRLLPPAKWREIEENYDKYGVKTLLMVRWLPAIRSPMFVSAGIMRLSFVRFVIADGVALMFGHSALFFLAWWFGDAFQSLVENAEKNVDRFKPLFVMIGIAAAAGFLLYHVLRRPVSTANPQEIPLIGTKVAATIEPHSGDRHTPPTIHVNGEEHSSEPPKEPEPQQSEQSTERL